MTELQWKTVSVIGFDELMNVLDRADRKGYMPDAIREEWEAFNWKQQPEQEPVTWESVLGAVARGWCHEENANKMMDSELAVAIAKEVHALYTTPPQPEQNEFNPDWDAMAVMVEEQQRMAKRIAELEAQQEPVAWLHTKIEGVAVPHRPADLDKHPDRWTALYPESKPCPTCEALARTVMLDQTSHDTAPPQRKPLTGDDKWKLWVDARSNVLQFARAIEAAHGIKE